MNVASVERDPRIDWHASSDPSEWAMQAARAIAAPLAAALATGAPRIRLLVSGGDTPSPVLEQLSRIDIDWSRITIGLVDDRDAPADDEGSNAKMVRERLLQGAAAAARFDPLRETERTLQDAVDHANRRWRSQAQQPVVVTVLGMGDDGHVASLFPDAANLDAVLVDPLAYAYVDATGSASAGEFPHRLSLTPAGLAAAAQRVLLIRGQKKLAVLNHALADGPSDTMPIRLAWQPVLAPLPVFWCSN